MSSIPHIVRHISPALLQEYSTTVGDKKMDMPDFAIPQDREEIFAQWKGAYDKNVQAKIEADLMNIDDMKSGRSYERMLALFQSQGSIDTLELTQLKSGYDRALWFFLNHSDIFHAIAEEEIFETSTGWTTYTTRGNAFDLTKIEVYKADFCKELGDSHYATELRGKRCHVDYNEHNGQHCFSAYPEDYAENGIEFDESDGLNRENIHRAVMKEYVMYDSIRRLVRVKTSGGISAKFRLARVFAQTVLGYRLDEENDRLIYNIERIRDPDFSFVFESSENIISAYVIYIDLLYPESKKKISLYMPFNSTKQRENRIIDWAKNVIPPGDWDSVQLSQIRIRFVLPSKNPQKSENKSTLTVNIGRRSAHTPTRPEYKGVVKFLERSGIFPKGESYFSDETTLEDTENVDE